MLAPGETLFFRCSRYAPIDYQRCGRVMEDRINSEHADQRSSFGLLMSCLFPGGAQGKTTARKEHARNSIRLVGRSGRP